MIRVQAHTSTPCQFLADGLGNHLALDLPRRKFLAVDKLSYSFIHLENLYSAPSRKLLRGASSPTTVKKISFKQLVEQRCVALW